MSLIQDPASFRDRSSTVYRRSNDIIRGIDATALENWRLIERCEFFQSMMSKGLIVRTNLSEHRKHLMVEEGAQEKNWAAYLVHERLPAVNYPYEWSFNMLKDGALLHLMLLTAALENDMILKDSSAFNVMFNGASPVFIDIPSFEAHEKNTPWVGYRQFCEHFLNPLLLQALKGIEFQPLWRGHLDGIPVHQTAQLLRGRTLIRPSVFMHVWLHDYLQKKHAANRQNIKKSIGGAGFHREMIKSNVKRLQKIISCLKNPTKKTEWSEYASDHSYQDKEFNQKSEFVVKSLARQPIGLLWDLGCNTGVFSQVASEHANYVLALDSDTLAIDILYTELKEKNIRNITPLVYDVTNPSPPCGWANAERSALSERVKPDFILCLAIIHHIVIGKNIPVYSFLEWLSGLCENCIIEFPTKEDEMVQALLANRLDQYDDYSRESFEQCAGKFFNILDQSELKSGKRIIYHLVGNR